MWISCRVFIVKLNGPITDEEFGPITDEEFGPIADEEVRPMKNEDFETITK